MRAPATDSRGHGAQGDPAIAALPGLNSPGFTAHETACDGEMLGALESPGGHEGPAVTAPEAAGPSDPDVGIYELAGGVTVIVWLCAECLAEKLEEALIGGSRWSAKRIGTVTGHGCDGHETKRQNERTSA